MARKSCDSRVEKVPRRSYSARWDRSGRRSPRLASLALAAAFVAVLAQHALLLGQRIADGSLLDPTVLARWVIGVLLTGALLALRRSGLSLVRGRQAAVFWLAVLVFHLAVLAVPAGLGNSAPAALLPGSSGPALLVLALVWVGTLGSRALAAPRAARSAVPCAVAALPARPLPLVLVARPPPLAAA